MEELVVNGANFFLEDHDEDVAASGVDVFGIMAPWPGDMFEQAIGRIEHYHRLAEGETRLRLAERPEGVRSARANGPVAVILGQRARSS